MLYQTLVEFNIDIVILDGDKVSEMIQLIDIYLGLLLDKFLSASFSPNFKTTLMKNEKIFNINTANINSRDK